VGDKAPAGSPESLASRLDERAGQLVADYEQRLRAAGSPLLDSPEALDHLLAQARATIGEVTASLRSGQPVSSEWVAQPMFPQCLRFSATFARRIVREHGRAQGALSLKGNFGQKP